MIAVHRDEIVARWRARVRAVSAETKTLRRSELEDNIPALLGEIVVALDEKTSVHQGSPNAAEHGRQRLRVGFDLNTVVAEYGMLRNCILDIAVETSFTPSLEEFRRLGDSINASVAESVVEYTKTRNQLFEMFVSVLSRDLKNPLQAIITGAVMLNRPAPLSLDVISRVSGQLAHGAGRIHRLVDQLLDLSRAGLGGGLASNCERFDLRDVCEKIVEELRAANPGREIRLQAAAPCMGSWDLDRISRVISSLVDNALSYGSPNQPIEVRLGGQPQEVVLEVHDLGNPIPNERLESLFNPFNQPSGGSLGLGLYVAREIVRAHSGTIEVESSEQEGTTFRIRLPREMI